MVVVLAWATENAGFVGSDKSMSETDVQREDRLELESTLRGRGYVKRRCLACDGLGVIFERGRHSPKCGSCDGTGHIWETPAESLKQQDK